MLILSLTRPQAGTFKSIFCLALTINGIVPPKVLNLVLTISKSIEQELPCFPALGARRLPLPVLRDAVPLAGQPARLSATVHQLLFFVWFQSPAPHGLGCYMDAQRLNVHGVIKPHDVIQYVAADYGIPADRMSVGCD